MKTINGRKYFGFWEGMPYGQVTDSYDEMRRYKNKINKDDVISHIKGLSPWVTSRTSINIFTGKEIEAGMYNDGEFWFPLDFINYYEEYSIGIPLEYEKYLNDVIGIK